MINSYLNKADWRIKENANTGYSIQGLNNYITNNLSKEWFLDYFGDEARRAHEYGYIHIHDLGFLGPYCTGWDMLTTIMEYGLSGVRGKVSAGPPKHFSSALGQIVNFMYSLAGEAAGAIAFNHFNTFLAPFALNDNLTKKQIKQQLQEFIFNMNVPTRVGFQTPFTNLTFDTKVPEFLTGCCPVTGRLYKSTDVQEMLITITEIFFNILYKGDFVGMPFAFPIPTINMTKSFYEKRHKYHWLWAATAKYGTPYFANYISSDMSEEDSLSMCCFTGNTEIICRVDGKLKLTTLRKIGLLKDSKLEVPIHGKWVSAIPVKVDYEDVFYKITLRNGFSYTMTKDHINVTSDGDKRTDELKIGDRLEYSDSQISYAGKGSYELGYFLGLYLAEGSHLGDGIQFSINKDHKDIVDDVSSFASNHFASHVSVLKNKGNSLTLAISNASIRALIDRFISGKGTDKHLVNIDNLNISMFEGIFNGWVRGDGKFNKEEAYTSSKKLAEQMVLISRLLGKHCNLREYERTVTLDGKEYTGTIYTLHICKKEKGKIYKTIDNRVYCEIMSIEEAPNSNKKAFCVQVVDNDPYFELGDGLVTHNCRLNIDLSKIRKGGVFAAGALTGSIGVVTLNMAAIETSDRGYGYEYYLSVAKEVLQKKREFVEKGTVDGLYPYSKFYLQGVKDRFGKYWCNHFSTIGVIGGYESGLSKKDQLHRLDLIKRILEDYQEDTGVLWNLEATPCEGASYRLAKACIDHNIPIKTNGSDEHPYLTNSTALPADSPLSFFEKCDQQEDLQTSYTGGTVMHMFIGEKIEPESVPVFLNGIFSRCKIPYMSITPTYSICPDCGYITGEFFDCPHCSAECDVYSRVVGFYRPVSQWNPGKQQEFDDREYDG